jgi:hypothetical protein
VRRIMELLCGKYIPIIVGYPAFTPIQGSGVKKRKNYPVKNALHTVVISNSIGTLFSKWRGVRGDVG